MVEEALTFLFLQFRLSSFYRAIYVCEAFNTDFVGLRKQPQNWESVSNNQN